ncbi:UNVERIFIED_CONTAM: hypothetical protein GTU68_010244 [Idotea baltica]|nr:hypothetical protein [Idotea baltica]
MSVLVALQQISGNIPKQSLVAITAAKEVKDKFSKSDLQAVCLGKDSSKAAEEALKYGFSKVYYSEDPSLEKYMAANYSQVILNLLKSNNLDTLVTAASSAGKDLAPRVSALWGAGQASDIVKVNDDQSLKRPLYAGNAFADVEILTDNKVITVRTTAFDPAVAGSASGEKEELSISIDAKYGEVVSYEMPESERPELADAEVVVSGGRALDSAENFEKYIFPLADALNAAIGASRAAVDSGYAPNDWQVGQTGKVVAPKLYIAIGISGAIQHLAGMKDSKIIVAINKDEEAPIFEVADYGLVADLYEVVEPLTEAINKAK